MSESYEGYVRFADGSIVSLQCFEGRHRDCPDKTPAGAELEGFGPLAGYYCECNCGDEGHASEARS